MTARSSIAEAVAALRAGGVIAYPTEAVWGLGCEPRDQAATLRLLAIKQREVEKGLILIAADEAQLAPFIDMAALDAAQRDAVRASWPGPHTWIVPASARVAIAGEGEGWHDPFCRAVFRAQFGEGRRIDDPAVIGALLQETGAPVRATFDRAQSDAVKLRLRTETEEAGRCGVFGAPSFLTPDGELFWGNDRLEAALRWASRGSEDID